MPLFLGSRGLGALPELVRGRADVRVAFVPAAAELEPDPFWVGRDRAVLESYGWAVRDVDPKDGAAAVSDVDVVVVPGGNTYHLLHRLRTSGFDAVLTAFVERGGMYAGISAGAIVAAPDIEPTAEPDQRAAVPDLSSTAGLGWVPFAVLPHAGRRTQRFVDHHNRVFSQGLGRPIVRVTDAEAVVVDDSGWRLVWSPYDS